MKLRVRAVGRRPPVVQAAWVEEQAAAGEAGFVPGFVSVGGAGVEGVGGVGGARKSVCVLAGAGSGAGVGRGGRAAGACVFGSSGRRALAAGPCGMGQERAVCL